MKTGKSIHIAAAALACALSAGCFSLEKANLRTSGQEHVLVSNYGWYLFHFIPVACGNANRNAWTPWVVLRDDVTLDKIQSRFMEYAEGQGCEASDLSYTTRESVMLEIPGTTFTVPVPYLLTYREVQLSGLMAKKQPAAGEEDSK